MEKEKINIKCPHCSQVIATQKPAKPGLYQLTCPKCSQQFKLQLRGVPIKMEEKKTGRGAKARQPQEGESAWRAQTCFRR